MASTKRFDKLPLEIRQSISLNITKAVCSFLELFISPIIARRIVSVLLIIAGVHSSKITQLTGLHERMIRDLKRRIVAGETDTLFEIRNGRGRKSKTKDVESQIIEEIEKGNYHSLQQIADMINEKFEIRISVMAVSRLLKKTESAN